MLPSLSHVTGSLVDGGYKEVHLTGGVIVGTRKPVSRGLRQVDLKIFLTMQIQIFISF